MKTVKFKIKKYMKVLASPSSIGQIDSKPFDILEKNGFTVVKNPFGRKLTEDETVNLAKDCIGIVAGVENLNKDKVNPKVNSATALVGPFGVFRTLIFLL